MGQYYKIVVKSEKTNRVLTVSDGGKLTEFSYGDMASVLHAFSCKGKYQGKRLEVAGDYAKVEKGKNMYYRIYQNEKKGKKYVDLNGLEFDDKEYRQKWCELFDNVYERDKEYGVRKEFRYVLNLDKLEYIDMNNRKENDFVAPVLILASDPTCMAQGGGDYFYRQDFDKVGRWHNDRLSVVSEVPEGYTMLDVHFFEPEDWRTDYSDKEIWHCHTICKLLKCISEEDCENSLPFTHAVEDNGGLMRYYDLPRATMLKVYHWWLSEGKPKSIDGYFNKAA